jgi:hypothetical protein
MENISNEHCREEVNKRFISDAFSDPLAVSRYLDRGRIYDDGSRNVELILIQIFTLNVIFHKFFETPKT